MQNGEATEKDKQAKSKRIKEAKSNSKSVKTQNIAS